MPGDSDEAGEALVTGLYRRFQRAARREGGPPLVLVHQVVQLDQVDPVGAQPLQRAPDLLVGSSAGPLAGLGRQEVLVAVRLHPRTQPELGLAVAGGGVEVVDAVAADQLHRLVGLVLADLAQRGGSEDDPGAVVAGPAERCVRDHAAPSSDIADSHRSTRNTGISRSVLRWYSAYGGNACTARSHHTARSSPSSSRAVASKRSAPSCTLRASGSALMLWYQTGCFGAPPMLATIRYAPSCSTFISGVLRSLPLLLPR